MSDPDLRQLLRAYNWDDGFDTPRAICSDPRCDLSLALELFYAADGYRYLAERLSPDTALEEWHRFIAALYQDIAGHRFAQTGTAFRIPLTRVQKYRLSRQQIPEIFLTDL